MFTLFGLNDIYRLVTLVTTTELSYKAVIKLLPHKIHVLAYELANAAGRLPEQLRKNRAACRIIEIETDRSKLKKLDAAQKAT